MLMAADTSSPSNNRSRYQGSPDSVVNVALIGSSGGGTATVGHTEARTLLQTIHQQLTLINAHLAYAIYITLTNGKSMESASEDVDIAILTVVTTASAASPHEFQVQELAKDTLARINEQAAHLQKQLALAIRSYDIDALICISIHIPLFTDVLRAAADRSLPVTGSGGSSLAQATAQFPGLLLSGNAGGSVATTTQTRAISYTYSLAQSLRRTQLYRPWRTSQLHQQQPSWTSVLNSTLPAFWAVTLARFLLHKLSDPGYSYPAEEWIGWFSLDKQELTALKAALDHFVLPAVCVTVMATANQPNASVGNSTTSTSSLVMGSLVASFGCRGSILAGLVAGYLVQALMVRWVIYPCIFANVPATMTTLLGAGGTGAAVGFFSSCFLSPAARQITAFIRFLIQWTVMDSSLISDYFPMAAAFLWGCLSCWSSKVGFYHAIHLPLILVELECGNGSFLGAVDELTLVLVSAGICTAKVLTWTTKVSDRALCRRGFLINLLAGDFVEVCYPYMEQSNLVNLSGYLASGLSCAILVKETSTNATHPPHSLAYLPWVASIALADENWHSMLLASLVAFVIPFLATLLAGMVQPKATVTGMLKKNV